MPQRPPKLEDQMTNLFSENNHDKAVVVEQVGDEIINESEVFLFLFLKIVILKSRVDVIITEQRTVK